MKKLLTNLFKGHADNNRSLIPKVLEDGNEVKVSKMVIKGHTFKHLNLTSERYPGSELLIVNVFVVFDVYEKLILASMLGLDMNIKHFVAPPKQVVDVDYGLVLMTDDMLNPLTAFYMDAYDGTIIDLPSFKNKYDSEYVRNELIAKRKLPVVPKV